MKKQWQTGVYLILYILILVFMADFNVMLLLDLKSFFILLAGTFLLALPFYEKGMGKDEFLYIYGSKAIEAGLIQVFIFSFLIVWMASFLENSSTIHPPTVLS